VLFLCHQGGVCHPSHVVPCHHNCHDHQRSWRLPHTCPLHSIEAIWTSTQTPSLYTQLPNKLWGEISTSFYAHWKIQLLSYILSQFSWELWYLFKDLGFL
jgi:hypothetical protein